MRQKVKRTVFGETMRRAAGIAAILVFVASLVCFWPGIPMSDTFARWASVYTITGDLDVPWAMTGTLTPVMIILMLAAVSLGFGTGAFLFIQLGFLALAAILWLRLTSSVRPMWVPLVFCLPIVFLYTSFVVPDVWILGALVVLASSLASITRGSVVFGHFLFFAACVILFGFRYNAWALLPVLGYFIFSLRGGAYWVRALLSLVLAAALAAVALIPVPFGFQGRTSLVPIVAWELIGALRIAEQRGLDVDPGLRLDDIANTDAAIARHSFVTADTLVFGENPPLPTTVLMDHESLVVRRWFRLILAHPLLYAETKGQIYKCMLGLCDGYIQTEIGSARPWPFLQPYVQNFNADRDPARFVLSIGNAMGRQLKVLLVPAFWVPVSVVVFLASWRRYNRFDRMLIISAAVYGLTFFILNAAASFRYMFPTYVVFTAYQLRRLV